MGRGPISTVMCERHIKGRNTLGVLPFMVNLRKQNITLKQRAIAWVNVWH